jgi:protein O-mannosyl-transferase
MTAEHKDSHILFYIIAAIVTATLAAYEPIRHNEFVTYDDNKYITENPLVTGGITAENIKGAFTKPHFFMWHPLTTLSHMLDCEIFGLNPAGHHFVSLVLHIINALLLLWILNKFGSPIWLSTFLAGVFALHPIQVESVAWAAERKTVLSGMFWLLTMAAYIRYAKQPGIIRYVVVLVVFGLCIMTKPVVVPVPFALLLLDYWPLERIRRPGFASNGLRRGKQDARHNYTLPQQAEGTSLKWLIIEKIPLAVMSALLSVITFVAQKEGGVLPTLDRMSMDYRLANVFLSYIRYIGKLLWPSKLAVCYPHPHLLLSDFWVVMCAVAFILLSILFLYIWRRKKYTAVGWLWYIGTLVPVIGLVQSGAQAMANRYMYMPMLGVLFIVGWGVKDIIEKRPKVKMAAIIFSSAALVTMFVLTRMQVSHWENTLKLFEYTLSVTENNPVAENGYGAALFNEGRIEEAEVHLRKAVLISPAFVTAISNLSNVYMKEGRYNETIESLNEIIKHGEATADTFYNMGTALSLMKKYDDSLRYFRKSLEMNSGDPDTHKRMGIVLLVMGKNSEAIVHLNEALRLKGGQVEVYTNLGTAYSQLGQYDAAIQNWAKALELQPNSVDVLNNLGWLYATYGDITAEKANQAINYASRACELTEYKNAEYLDALGAALAAAGKFEEAKAAAQKALDIAKAGGQATDEIEKRIKLYEAGQPYHQK